MICPVKFILYVPAIYLNEILNAFADVGTRSTSASRYGWVYLLAAQSGFSAGKVILSWFQRLKNGFSASGKMVSAPEITGFSAGKSSYSSGKSGSSAGKNCFSTGKSCFSTRKSCFSPGKTGFSAGRSGFSARKNAFSASEKDVSAPEKVFSAWGKMV